jgi:NADPH-dependent curcumin reductase CurA
MSDMNRQLVLVKRPADTVTDDCFEMRTGPIPEPGPGEVLVRNLWLSFDPTQRGWMNDEPGYLPPVQIGDPMRASGVGQVVASNSPDLGVGDLVSGLLNWQDYIVTSTRGGLGSVNKVPDGVPPTAMLGVFGITGMTAYFGVVDICEPKPGDVFLVSGAAGATGSVAGQVAKLLGCKVIGIAGGPDKCAWVTDVAGFDHCIDYKNDDIDTSLGELAPDGVNIYFDNVGGTILDTTLRHLAMNARVAICGDISSGYSSWSRPVGLQNHMNLVLMRARMEGFLVIDYIPRFGEGIAQMAQWVVAGQVKWAEDMQHGLENSPATLRRLFEGKNLGKQLLQIAEPSTA